MSECKHYSVTCTVWRSGGGGIKRWFDCATFEEPDAKVCNGCNRWLSLGKASDEPEAVRVEMRAAEIAADAADGVGVGGHRPDHIDENHCWHVFNDDLDQACCFCNLEYDAPTFAVGGCHAGYLARCIVTHGEP